MKIDVIVKAGSKIQKVQKIDEKQYKVWVKSPPVKGMANKEVIETIAKFFNLSKSQVKIISGFTWKEKVVEINS